MTVPSLLPEAMPPLTTITRSLSQFASSPSSFQIVHTFPPSLARSPATTLYILDSSFNPPTIAHANICLSALRDEGKRIEDERKGVKRLLLLLATKNADKAPTPVAFPHRLAMMGALAQDLRRMARESEMMEREGAEQSLWKDKAGEFGREERLDTGREDASEDLDLEDCIIDIGITKEAMFVDKARAIVESGVYSVSNDHDARMVEQVYLAGFDTLIRLVDTKYYPNESLTPLQSFFKSHCLRVAVRSPPSKDEQVRFVRELERQLGEAKGKVELVEGGGENVSSTRARECFRDSRSRQEKGKQWCSPAVIEHIIREGLYLEEHAEVDLKS